VSIIRKSFKDKSLDELARQIRESLRASREAASNALDHALDAGDALAEAINRVSTDKKKRLRDNCFLAVSTAYLYLELAAHRSEIEAARSRAGELSIRAARRLIAKPSGRSRRPTPELITAARKASDAELTALLEALGLERFLRVMPGDWRPQLEARIVNLRADAGHPNLKITAVVRKALSLIKTANAPGTSGVVGESNRQEACAALQQVNALAGQHRLRPERHHDRHRGTVIGIAAPTARGMNFRGIPSREPWRHRAGRQRKRDRRHQRRSPT
jgi:hypothetical protein